LVMYKKTGKQSKFDLFPGKSNPTDGSKALELVQLSSADCSGNDAVAACWRDVENHWEVMLGTEFKNYEISRITMFRNKVRERVFYQELQGLKDRAASRSGPVPQSSVVAVWEKKLENMFTEDWDNGASSSVVGSALLASAIGRQLDREPFSIEEDINTDQKEKRSQWQQQTMRHFSEFSEKFSLLPKEDNKDVNLSVAWWGKSPASYLNNAQHGFFNLPANVKLDPGNPHLSL